MEKDDRSKNKRNRMRQFKKNHYQNISHNSPAQTTSSPVEKVVQQLKKQPVIGEPLPTLSDEEIEHGSDFSSLQNSTGSGGNFFSFSSEKNWECDDEIITSQDNTYFTLNLKLLNAGLRTIPFYNRMNYPVSDFTKSEIVRMDAEAKGGKDTYSEILLNNSSEAKGKKPAKKDKDLPKFIKDQLKILKNDNKDDELDELLNLTKDNLKNISLVDEKALGNILSEEQKQKQKNEKLVHKITVADNSSTTDDLQDWLDKVLE